MNNETYIFGQKEAINWLCVENASDFLYEAYEKANLATSPDIECILEILDSVSKAWANPEYHLRKKAAEHLSKQTSFSNPMIDEGLNNISAICSRTNLEKRIYCEIGSLEVFNEGEIQPGINYRLRAIPNGVVFHINNDKLFVEVINSFVSGIITKNANIIKMSTPESVFPILFLESIKEFDSTGIIWPRQAIVYWENNNKSLENILFNSKLTLIFNSKYADLKKLKPSLCEQIKLIDNYQRYSFAAIEGKCLKPSIPSNLIKGLAYDICKWDQQTSYSPHVVYVLDKDLKTSHQLIESLFDEMIQITEELPCGHLSFDEKVEIRKIREITRMKQVKSEGRLVCPEEFEFTLILEYNQSFKISCLNRTIYIKRISNIEDLIEQISPISEYLHTVGLCCTEDSKNHIEKELINSGIKRITDIGSMNQAYSNGIPNNGSFLLQNLIKWVSVEYKNVDAEAETEE